MGMHPYGKPTLRRQDLRDDPTSPRTAACGTTCATSPTTTRATRRCTQAFGEHFGRPARDPKLGDKSLDPFYCDIAASHPEGDRGDRAQDGAPPARRCTGLEEPVHGRRRRAELGRQLQDPARRAASRTSTSSPRRATTAARSARRYWAYNHLLGQPRGPALDHAYLGSEYSRRRDRGLPRQARHRATSTSRTTSASSTSSRATLVDGKVCGWFRGRFEWGPRALGARSIIADPRKRRDEGEAQRDDQVPRGVPALRAVGARGARRRVLRAPRGRAALPRALHALRDAGARGQARRAPRDHARGRLRPPADGATRRPTPPTTA